MVAVRKQMDPGHIVRVGNNGKHIQAQHTEEALDTAQRCLEVCLKCLVSFEMGKQSDAPQEEHILVLLQIVIRP